MDKEKAFLSFNHNIISFKVSETFSLSDTLTTCTVQQFESAITFAMTLVNLEISLTDDYARKHLCAEQFIEVEQKHKAECSALQSEYFTKLTASLSPLITKISDLETSHQATVEQVKRDYELRLKALQKEKAATESESSAFKADLEVTCKREEKALRKRVSELEIELQAASQTEHSIRERCQHESDRFLEAIERKNIELFQIKQDALDRREHAIASKEQELQVKLQRSVSSVFRGQDGEAYFGNIAKEKKGWHLENTSKIPHSCDYSSTILNTPVFFELKNYGTAAVKHDEVTKFLRDMKEHPEVLVGIFISLRTGISGKSSSTPISIDWVHENQCVVYIQTLSDLDIDHVLSLIEQIVHITNIFNRNISLKDMKEDGIIQQRIDRAKIFLDQSITRGNKLLKRIITDNRAQIEAIEVSINHVISELKHQHADIVSSIDTLLGTYTQVDDVPKLIDAVTVLPVKKPRKKKDEAVINLSPGILE
jgi:23S rRNA pseudoU1915 N3-methylase RlmH